MNASGHVGAPCLAAALDYASRGWCVFPARIGDDGTKKGCIAGGHGNGRRWGSTADPDLIRDYWRRFPQAMVGIACGAESGLFVVEADTLEAHGVDGIGNLERLVAEHGGLPHTIEAWSPSGSRHLYLAWPGAGEVRNSAGRVAPGIDVRGEAGMVIAPPSVRPGAARSYRWKNPPPLFELAPCPAWLLDLCRKPVIAEAPGRAVAARNPGGEAHAGIGEVAELLGYIGPDDGSYDDWLQGLMALHDHFGGDAGGLALAIEWSARGASFRPGEVEAKWRSFTPGSGIGIGSVAERARRAGADLADIARRHRRSEGPAAPAALHRVGSTGDPEVHDVPDPKSDPRPGAELDLRLPSPFAWCDPASIPPRRFLYGRHLVRGHISTTVAPGGVGKSSHSIVEALAMASGRRLLGTWVGAPLRVWLYNLEDPADELQRRVTAAMQHHGITPAEIAGRLFVDGRERELLTAIQDRSGVRLDETQLLAMEAELRARSIDVLIVDPFVSTHLVDENSNSAMDRLVKGFWSELATRCDIAVELVHHTRKLGGEVGTSEAGRGASALLAAARSGRVLNRMSREERDKAGIGESDASAYFSVQRDKANLAPAGTREWRRVVSVDLANGDSVGVVEAWDWPDDFDAMSVRDLLSVQNAIDAAGVPLRYSDQASPWVGEVIADVLGLDAVADRKRLRRMIEAWLRSGALMKANVMDGGRKFRPCVQVGEWASG